MPTRITPDDFDAVLFDLDGVLTTTRTVHAAAWKRTFEEFLTGWDAADAGSTPRFDERSGYGTVVDGKPREAGVRDFLAWQSRPLTGEVRFNGDACPDRPHPAGPPDRRLPSGDSLPSA